MPDRPTAQQQLDARLAAIVTLLNRQRILEDIARRQSGGKGELVESLVHRQAEGDLRARLHGLAAADVAHLLEMLPPHRRQTVWAVIDDGTAGDVLWAVTDRVADALIAATPRERLVAITRRMDADTLSQIVPQLPADLLPDLERTLEPPTRSWLCAAGAYPEHSVGRVMDPDLVVVDVNATVKDVLRLLRRLDVFPEPLDALFVVDDRDRLVGRLPLKTVLKHRPRQTVAAIAEPDVVSFTPTEQADEAARAFERYDLVTAPVIDDRGRLVGRLTVDTVMDVVRREAEEAALKREGLSAEEDLFGGVWGGARRRWFWLAVNLVSAFLASRVIGLFEDSIERLVALATLMPIVASVGGNTGNQTVALIVRGLALDQVTGGNLAALAWKEVAIGAINGLLWGGVMGFLAVLLYGDVVLGLVMAAAMVLNLVIAAAVGLAVPTVMYRLGRDPALGSSVLLTFTTDSMGFFIFLGLATVFLVS